MVIRSWKKRRLPLLVVLVIALLAVSGCGQSEQPPEREVFSDEAKQPLTVVTSFYPIYIFTLNVTQGIPGVEVVNLTDRNSGDLHDYALTPEDMKTLEKAQVLVINGAGLESFLEKAIAQLPHLTVIDTSMGIELLTGNGEGHGHEEGHGSEVNPHIWVSLENAIVQVRNIGEQLAQVDPEHADAYRQNAQEYIAKLERQKEKMHRELKDIANRQIVTFHNAFPYFAREFDLEIVGVVQSVPGSDPNAKELAALIDTMKRLKIKTIFAEPQYPDNIAHTIANETGAKVYVLDPVVTGPLTAEAYVEIMDRNLQTLLEALADEG